MGNLGREEVEKRAEEIIVSFGIGEPPVDLMDIVRKFGYTLRSVRFTSDDLHGSVSVKNGVVFIDFRLDDPPNRQRFTIAHEIGHARLHLWKDGEYDEGVGYIDSARILYRLREVDIGNMVEEREANQFAASLLMPSTMLCRFYGKTKSTLDLALRFNVSEEAMFYRLNRLKSLGRI
jgi:Zn-dependent peptidase ImmA (M78 family)